MPTKNSSSTTPKKRQRKKLISIGVPRAHHFDKHADQLAKEIRGSDDQLLDTPQTAALMKVSHQFLEIGRHRGFGPPFMKLGRRLVRYRRGDVKEYLKARTHLSTSEYAK